ncbi:MAG: right-handed parallel beta-helix repeat-containing protein [Kiritimatiellae bacterium]|nr:right-handed parallel beta-helix repeat-containing protein [Kiritimatiellia bacterium]
MKSAWTALLFIWCWAAYADTHYVSLAGTNNSPYANWPDAATNIQLAVDQSEASDTILVSNGTYVLTQTVSIAANVIVQGFGGTRDEVIIDGNYPAASNGCVKISAAGAVLRGFTITRGFNTNFLNVAKGGGGVRCTAAGTIDDCVIVSNQTLYDGGGGIYMTAGAVTNSVVSFNNTFNQLNISGGGIYMSGNCLVSNCFIFGNWASCYGGGVYGDKADNVVVDCIISNNISRISNYSAASYSHGGGGIAITKGTVRNCQIINNMTTNTQARSYARGGGMHISGICLVENCVIRGNRLIGRLYNYGGGGVASYANGGVLRNCLITENIATVDGGGISSGPVNLAGGLAVQNCTIASNNANGIGHGGGFSIEPSATGTNIFENTIIYQNTAAVSGSNWDGTTGFTLTNCCTAPTNSLPGSDNVDDDPLFINAINDFHLSNRSPCINAGIYRDWMTNAVDLDGRSRISARYLNVVDIGAYEFLPKGSIFTGL